jgi:hypothetical protein
MFIVILLLSRILFTNMVRHAQCTQPSSSMPTTPTCSMCQMHMDLHSLLSNKQEAPDSPFCDTAGCWLVGQMITPGVQAPTSHCCTQQKLQWIAMYYPRLPAHTN